MRRQATRRAKYDRLPNLQNLPIHRDSHPLLLHRSSHYPHSHVVK